MSAAAPVMPRIGERERLSATMVLSLLLHGVLLVGVGFALEDAAPVMPTLDVILTQTQSPLTSKQADFLAQADNQGGGEHDKAVRPRDAQIGQAPQEEEGDAPRPLRAQSPAPSPPPQARVISSSAATATVPQPKANPQVEPDTLPPGASSFRSAEYGYERCFPLVVPVGILRFTSFRGDPCRPCTDAGPRGYRRCRRRAGGSRGTR